jgi:L,D-transpeptidase ErfK/SrfK
VKQNNLDVKKRLIPGQILKVNTRRIVPMTTGDGIIINIPDRTLYFFKNNTLEIAFPVGLGKAFSRGKPLWRTPEGKFKVMAKEKDPTWNVPESIQLEMDMEDKEILVSVPPGPDNPLGRYAVKTSIPGIMIHETIWPSTVYTFSSHGCIRVYPAHMEKFFEKVEKNIEGEIIYRPVKVAVTKEGRVFIEVHKDVYRKINNVNDEAKLLIERYGISDRVDWQKVTVVVEEKAGIAEDVTLFKPDKVPEARAPITSIFSRFFKGFTK